MEKNPKFSILANTLIPGGGKKKIILKQRAASGVDLMLVRGTVAFGMQLLLSDSFAAQKVLDLFC